MKVVKTSSSLDTAFANIASRGPAPLHFCPLFIVSFLLLLSWLIFVPTSAAPYADNHNLITGIPILRYVSKLETIFFIIDCLNSMRLLILNTPFSRSHPIPSRVIHYSIESRSH